MPPVWLLTSKVEYCSWVQILSKQNSRRSLATWKKIRWQRLGSK